MKCPTCEDKDLDTLRTASGVIHRCAECGFLMVPWEMLIRFSDDPGRFENLLRESQAFLLPTGRICPVCQNRLFQGRVTQTDAILTFCTQCKTLWMEPWQLYEIDAASSRALQTQMQNPKVPVVPLPKMTPPAPIQRTPPPAWTPLPPIEPRAIEPLPTPPPVPAPEPTPLPTPTPIPQAPPPTIRPMMPQMPTAEDPFVPPIFAQKAPPPSPIPPVAPPPAPSIPPTVSEPPKPTTGKIIWPKVEPMGEAPSIFQKSVPPPTTPQTPPPLPPLPIPPDPVREISLPPRGIQLPALPAKAPAPNTPSSLPKKFTPPPPVIPKSFPVGPSKPQESLVVKMINGTFGFLLGSKKSTSIPRQASSSVWGDFKDVMHEIWYAIVKGKPTKKLPTSAPKVTSAMLKAPTQARYMPAPKEEIRMPRVDSHFPKPEPAPTPPPVAQRPPAPIEPPAPQPAPPPPVEPPTVMPPPIAPPPEEIKPLPEKPKKKSFLSALSKAIDKAWDPLESKKKPTPEKAPEPAPAPAPVVEKPVMEPVPPVMPAPAAMKPVREKKPSNMMLRIALWAPRVLPIGIYLLIGLLEEEWGTAFIAGAGVWAFCQLFRLIWIYPKNFRDTTVETLGTAVWPLKRSETAVRLKGTLHVDGQHLHFKDATGEIALNRFGPLEILPRILGLVGKGQYPEGEFTLSGWIRPGKVLSVEVLEARDEKRPRKSLVNGARWLLAGAVLILSVLLYLAE